jgi:hypothetical protein
MLAALEAGSGILITTENNGSEAAEITSLNLIGYILSY